MIGRVGFCCCALLTALTLITGCQQSAEDKPGVDRSTGPLADEHYQWTASPGIDLLTGPAVPVRAFIESRLDAQFMHSLDYAYPGFDRAVAESPAGASGDVFTNSLRPDVTRGSASEAARVGNNRFLIQSLMRNGDTVTATLCNYRYALALEQDGQFVSVVRSAAEDDGIDAMLVRMSAPPSDSDSALPPQQGPAVAPAVDVFGDWKITGFLASYAGTDAAFAEFWPSRDADLARCVAQAPDPPDRRAFLTRGEHPRSDFPTSPPSPGWPEAVSN